MEATSKPTILVVDDEPIVRKLLRMTLGSDVVTIVEARDGLEAIAMAQATRPDLVLLDVRLPELDGYEVCARLKADPATADSHVVLLTTAVADGQPALDTLDVDGVITKPFSPLGLLHLVYGTLHLT